MRYDLGDAELRRIAAAASPAGHRGRFVVVVAGPDHPLADAGRTLERLVFEAAFGNDTAQMTAEYGAYERRSRFFVCLDRRSGRPAGVVRVIEGDGAGVKTVDDAPAHIGVGVPDILARHGMRGEKVWDFATVAVLPEYRGNLAVSSLLYRTFLVEGERAGAVHVVVMLDRRAYRNITLLGAPLTPLAGSGPFAYLGSAENRALYVPFAVLGPAIAAQARRLLRPGARIAGEIRARGLRRVFLRLFAAWVSYRVATGRGLDRHIAGTSSGPETQKCSATAVGGAAPYRGTARGHRRLVDPAVTAVAEPGGSPGLTPGGTVQWGEVSPGPGRPRRTRPRPAGRSS